VKKRVFKLKTFARWAKKLLPDERLCEAAQDILNGHYEADLGSGLCKKRIAMPGQGKSGATRTLVAYCDPVVAAGGLPLIAPAFTDPSIVEEALDHVQGVLLSGGSIVTVVTSGHVLLHT
jgi:hypothetical protein